MGEIENRGKKKWILANYGNIFNRYFRKRESRRGGSTLW